MCTCIAHAHTQGKVEILVCLDGYWPKQLLRKGIKELVVLSFHRCQLSGVCVVQSVVGSYVKPCLHWPCKVLCKLVYVKPISCKRIKVISKLICIPRWFGTGLKRFRRACKQLKCFKLLYKIQALTLPSLLFSKRSPLLIASKPRSSHAGMSLTASEHECYGGRMQVATLHLQVPHY